MIQFNLLPDVKLEYVKAERLKRLVTSICILVIAASLAVLMVLILTVDVWQKVTINSLQDKIKDKSQQLQDTPNLNKILTIQNQLNSLDDLHSDKPDATRLFGYLDEVTPSGATISDLLADYDESTLSISGTADTLEQVNTFVDGLKFTKYQEKGTSDKTDAFSDVVLSDFSRSQEGAQYTIDMTFDPVIFDNTHDIELQVPSLVTTRSVLDSPKALFKAKPDFKGEEQ